MTLSDWFLLAMRWLHALAATAWVGGNIFFFAVLRPAAGQSPEQASLTRAAGQEFRHLVDTALWVLLVTGAVMAVDRLTSGHATVPYGAVLGLKITLALWMFYLVWFRRRRSITPGLETPEAHASRTIRMARTLFSASNLILLLGVAVLLLSDVLSKLFELSLMGS